MTILLAVVVCLIHASQVRGYGTMDECKRRGEVYCVRRGYHGVACVMLKSMPPQIRSSCIEEVHVGDGRSMLRNKCSAFHAATICSPL